MPIADRYIHALAIVTPSKRVDDAVDDYGQPIPGEPTVVLVSGLIQPAAARTRSSEVPLANQAGPGIASHVVFLARRTIDEGAYIRFADDDGDRYEVVAPPRDFHFGTQSDHIEVDCRRVASQELVAS